MITAQVYQTITARELAAIAQACGFAAKVDDDERGMWMQVGGQATRVGLVQDRDRVIFLDSLPTKSTAARANAFNDKTATWSTAYVTDDGRPFLLRWNSVAGVTREHLAEEMFHWEYYIGLFVQHFA